MGCQHGNHLIVRKDLELERVQQMLLCFTKDAVLSCGAGSKGCNGFTSSRIFLADRGMWLTYDQKQVPQKRGHRG